MIYHSMTASLIVVRIEDRELHYTNEEGDMLLLLGARTLEGLNLTVDSRLKKLVAAGPLPVAYVRGLKWQREKRRL